jgi:hypothetical protein
VVSTKTEEKKDKGSQKGMPKDEVGRERSRREAVEKK